MVSMTTHPSDLVLIADRLRAHGVRGEVRGFPLSGEGGRFVPEMAVVWRHRGASERPLTVEAVRAGDTQVWLRFREIPDRTAAEALSGGTLWADLPAGDAGDLAPDTYYHYQLVGLAVVDEAGQSLGRLTRVVEGAAHDLYEVTSEGNPPFLVPAVAEFIRRVDVATGRMVIRVLPGLIPDPPRRGK